MLTEKEKKAKAMNPQNDPAYYVVGLERSHDVAENIARGYREQGHNARLMKSDGFWEVYVKPKQLVLKQRHDFKSIPVPYGRLYKTRRRRR